MDQLYILLLKFLNIWIVKLRLAEMTEVHSKEILATEVKLKQLEEEKGNLMSCHAKEKGELEQR